MNKNSKAIALALAAVLAGGAVSAQGFSAAQLQLSSQAGVEPGVFSVGQLNAIINAERDDSATADPAQLARSFLLENSGEVRTSSNAQLAAQARVEPGLFTDAQLHMIIKMDRRDDPAARQLLIDAYTRENSGANAGLDQMAARAGIDPTGMTPSQVAAAYLRATSSLD